MTDIEENKKEIVELLNATERKGMISLVTYLKGSDFFEAPASTKYHAVYPGGLAHHSLRVYRLLCYWEEELELNTPHDSIIIAGLLHDVCKIGAYLKSPTEGKYHWNSVQPKGHAMLSLVRIAKHIKLTDLETKMIQYHMGVYGLNEFDPKKGEYNLRDKGLANAWFHHPIVKVMYFCDELVTLGE